MFSIRRSGNDGLYPLQPDMSSQCQLRRVGRSRRHRLARPWPQKFSPGAKVDGYEVARRDSDSLSGGQRPLPIPLRQSKPRGKHTDYRTQANQQAGHLE